MKKFITSKNESFNYYLEKVRNTKQLTKEEEQSLDLRIISGDASARNELIEANLRFVLSCALALSSRYVPIEELVAAGNYGLTIAASRYNPSYANRFCTYAVHHVRKAIKESIKTWVSQVSTPCLRQGIYADISLDDTHDEDEENWSWDLIDLIPALPMSSEEYRDLEESKEQLRYFLSKWYYPSDVQMLMDFAQMEYDGYSIHDLAKKYGLPTKKVKSIIADLQLKARLYKLQAAYAKAA